MPHILLHNLYVGDLLRRNLRCGSFSLTKLISNKKVVIQSFPESDRRNGVKMQI